MLSRFPLQGRVSLGLAILTAFLVLLPAGHATAEEQDIVGIYFDREGLTTTFHTMQPWQTVTAWLVLINISAESGVQAIGIWGAMEGTIWDWCSWSLMGGLQIPTCDPYWILGAAPPIPWTYAIPVVEIGIVVHSLDEWGRLYIQPPPPYDPFDGIHAFYQANDGVPGTLVPLHPSSGSYDLPVAGVNVDVVPVTSSSWGAVKALYRSQEE
jgi:hypothetical protein